MPRKARSLLRGDQGRCSRVCGQEGWGAPEARLLASFPGVSAWAQAMLSRPSVAAAEPADLASKSRRFFADRAARARAA
jgi:hypothetical protein